MGRSKPFRVSEFNPDRLIAGGISPDHEQVQRDPKYPGLVVKSSYYENNDVARQCMEWTNREILRLQRACPELQHGYNFTITEPAGEDAPGFVIAHHYSQRLQGEELDISNPEHWPLLRAVGAGLLTYMEETPVGGDFCGEFMHYFQYTKGGLYFDHRSNPNRLFLHDDQAVPSPIFCTQREAPGTPTDNRDVDNFADSAHVLRTWLDAMPSESGVSELQARAHALCLAAPQVPFV